MSQSDTAPEGFPITARHGVDGCVVRFGDTLTEAANRAAIGLQATLERGAIEGVEEASSALASVYVRFGSVAALHKGMLDLSRILEEEDFYSAPLPRGRRHWIVPASFGGEAGPQLASVASQVGLSETRAVEELTEARLRVLAIGFAPGQPYLGELPENWHLPRLSDLIDVPAGALVVAIRQIVLFANASPTGWQHVGRTGFRLYRPEDEVRPFALAPGDEVSFRPVAAEHVLAPNDKGDGAVWEPIP